MSILSKGPNWVGVFPPPFHLRTERDPVSETSCFPVSRIADDGKSPPENKPVILCVIHHRQNSSESAGYTVPVMAACVQRMRESCQVLCQSTILRVSFIAETERSHENFIQDNITFIIRRFFMALWVPKHIYFESSLPEVRPQTKVGVSVHTTPLCVLLLQSA
jgi:hypothetical protein